MTHRIHLAWNGRMPDVFRSGVSLHSHTLHSRESLCFLYRAAAAMPLLSAALKHGERRYLQIHGSALDLTRGFWTPPLGPYDAWKLERTQIERLGLNSLVSLTDHDDIEAPVSLHVVEHCKDLPVSFEWTVPYSATFFHLGIHNLPLSHARSLFQDLQEYTKTPRPERLPELLDMVAKIPESLIVFNHPLWDEGRIGESHGHSCQDFLHRLGRYVHALELNGLRPWRENRAVIALAETFRKPVISGGDRHGFEPNAILNLTAATSFPEFVAEVRDGQSDVLIMSQYRESHFVRIMNNISDILRPLEGHANGWILWSDRVFYESGDGRIRSLTELFASKPPAAVAAFLTLMQFLGRPKVRELLRTTFATGEEVAH